MEWLVVSGLIALVVYLARQAPGVQPTTSVGPDMNVPATGLGLTSPATGGGSPYASSANQLRLATSYQLVGEDQKVLARDVPDRYWGRRRGVVVGGNYMTDADSSLRTQDVPALVQTVPNGSSTSGQKI